MDKNVNEVLLKEQKYWVDYVLSNYWENLKKGSKNGCVAQDKILSHPFYMGLTDEYIVNADCRKRVMIVGQEAMGYGSIYDGTAKYGFVDSCTPKKCEENTNEAVNSQQWAKAYLMRQFGESIALPKCYKNEIGINTSPFWEFFRKLKGKFELCWNNLDKVYFVSKGELSLEAEKILSSRYPKQGEEKSLLQREIALAEPQLILFVTGPYYSVSMEKAFGLMEKELNGHKPDKENYLTEITEVLKIKEKNSNNHIPVFWTYHPNYLNHKGKLQKITEKIINLY